MYFLTFYEFSDGNQKDDSMTARHTQAVGRPHGVFGSAAIGTLDPWKLKTEKRNDLTLPELGWSFN